MPGASPNLQPRTRQVSGTEGRKRARLPQRKEGPVGPLLTVVTRPEQKERLLPEGL